MRTDILTDEECDQFRRMPGSFNDMLRAVYKAGMDSVIQKETDTIEEGLIHINKKFLDALQILMNEGLADRFVYDVREHEGEGWEGPRVKEASEAVGVIRELLKGHGYGK